VEDIRQQSVLGGGSAGASPSSRLGPPSEWRARLLPSRVGMWLPPASFVGGNAVLFFAALLCPSFALIRVIYNFNTLFMPAIFLAGAAAAVFMRPRRYAATLAALALVGFGFRIYATHIEPYRLKLRTVSIRTPKVSQPLRILHISDIQSASVGAYEAKAFAQMRELKPDLIVHTGDLLQPLSPATWTSELPKIAALLRTLEPRLGVYGVVGDTDGRIRGLSAAELGNLYILSNEEAVLEWHGARLRLFGLPCAVSRGRVDGTARVRNWFARTAPADFTIVLGHAPDYVPAVLDLPIDLCLAGHTHGGQVRIPWLGPLLTLSAVPRAWARGYREVGSTRLNVSAGIGCEHLDRVPPIRFACPPEMTLIELVPSEVGNRKSEVGSWEAEEPALPRTIPRLDRLAMRKGCCR